MLSYIAICFPTVAIPRCIYGSWKQYWTEFDISLYKKSQDTTVMQLKPAQKPLSAKSIAQLLLYYKLLEI
jgi:hypothetical protein